VRRGCGKTVKAFGQKRLQSAAAKFERTEGGGDPNIELVILPSETAKENVREVYTNLNVR
jgi:hypothetical protein